MAEGSCSSSQKEEREKRPTFGGRRLEDASRVLEHNAWCVLCKYVDTRPSLGFAMRALPGELELANCVCVCVQGRRGMG